MGFSPMRALIDMPLPWSRPAPKVNFESRDLLDMCKTLATSNMVTVPALRQIKAWLSGGIDPNAAENPKGAKGSNGPKGWSPKGFEWFERSEKLEFERIVE